MTLTEEKLYMDFSTANINEAIENEKNEYLIDKENFVSKFQKLSREWPYLCIFLYFSSNSITSEELNPKLHDLFSNKNCFIMIGQQYLWFTIGACQAELK